MVKIIKGSYGHRKGKVIVPVYAGETVELTPEQEVRLVKLGVAEVVNPNGKTSGGKPPKAPEGNSDNDEQSDALPEYDEKMKLVELKEMLEADRDVFLNLGEFGEEHSVEGKKIPAVLDEAVLVDSKAAEDLGLTQGDLVLFAKCEDLPEQRDAGESLRVDGKGFLIASWRVDYGMAKVYLVQNRGR